MMNEAYHIPVMLAEAVDGLQIKPSGRYADLTFGGGGHSREILKRLNHDGNLVVFDQDEEALVNLPEDDRLIAVHHNFRFLQQFLEYHEMIPLDGILADLGVSSHQFDELERGFSFRDDAPLDMRMSEGLSETAADMLNAMTAQDLQQVFSKYGEVRNARTLSLAIVAFRKNKLFERNVDLMDAMSPCMPSKHQSKYKAQVFQALRIHVNQEMDVLTEMLSALPDCVVEGGRVVVISYHSIEDRLVKNMFQFGNPQGERKVDEFGRQQLPFKAVNKKPMVPSAEEVSRNPRSRSAKLRIAEKI